jgi:hypothetical protein
LPSESQRIHRDFHASLLFGGGNCVPTEALQPRRPLPLLRTPNEGGGMTTAEIAELFNAKTIARGRYQAFCMAHSDKSPSLAITEGQEGRTLLKCWAGCSLDSILAAAGLGKRDLFGKSRTLTPEERERLRQQKLANESREEALKSIERQVFDAERLAEIDVRRWAGALALIPEGHEHEQALKQLFNLSLTAFRESEAESICPIQRRHPSRIARSVRPEVERVAA